MTEDPYRADTPDEPIRKRVLCTDCRYAGWLTEDNFIVHQVPTNCLISVNGGDHTTGDRVIVGRGFKIEGSLDAWFKRFPRTWTRNSDGTCADFQPVTIPWWRLLFRERRRMRT